MSDGGNGGHLSNQPDLFGGRAACSGQHHAPDSSGPVRLHQWRRAWTEPWIDGQLCGSCAAHLRSRGYTVEPTEDLEPPILERPGPPPAIALDSRTAEIFYAWLKFYRDNPNVWAELQTMALRMFDGGRMHYGISTIWEVVRWHRDTEALDLKTDGDSYKLNDHHQPIYSRLLMRANPQLLAGEDRRSFFETRKRGTYSAFMDKHFPLDGCTEWPGPASQPPMVGPREPTPSTQGAEDHGTRTEPR